MRKAGVFFIILFLKCYVLDRHCAPIMHADAHLRQIYVFHDIYVVGGVSSKFSVTAEELCD